jgi:hypothetical protein
MRTQIRRLAVVSAIANAAIVCGFSTVLAMVLNRFSQGARFQATLYSASWPFTMGYSFRSVLKYFQPRHAPEPQASENFFQRV